MKRLLVVCLAIAAAAAWSAPARAFTPQTIVVDGHNDFNPANLLDDDRGDTEIKDWCPTDYNGTGPDSTMDLGRIYVTNDANYLYLGWEYYVDCFGKAQLGIAFDVKNSPAGGIKDPFTRKISWLNLANRPDCIVYVEEGSSTYQILYKWNAAGQVWADSTTLVNPSGAGSHALGCIDSTHFMEMRLPLSALHVNSGDQLNLELWMTQDGALKGPLDAMCSDGVQMSRATGTTFDTTASDTVHMTCMKPYTVLSAIDNTPPTVQQANGVGYQLLANKTFNTVTNKVDVLFSEPVGTGATTTANYTVSGAASPSVISALVDGANTSLVHLTLGASIGANASFYNVTVQNVKDVAGNTILANGTSNVGSFFLQNVQFQMNAKLRLCKGEFATADSFYVEGSVTPLTFVVADNARLLDANSDSIYTGTIPFSLPKSSQTGKAEADLEFKFSHTPSGQPYEPLANNRTLHLTSDSAAVRIFAASWNDDDPSNFTSHPINVVFKVNANSPYMPAGGPATHHLWLNGDTAPLSFSSFPGLAMKDDGVAPDQVAGDKIFTLQVTFPGCSSKNVNWKVRYDSLAVVGDTLFECLGQGDRTVFLDDAVYDAGANPLVLPARGMNRCNITDKAVAVTFRVQMGSVTPLPGAADTVVVMGGHSPNVTGPAFAFPLNAGPPINPASRLFDNGTAPDAHAGDGVFTRTITFPESTGVDLNFKYWLQRWANQSINAGYECSGFGDRTLTLDDVNHSVAVPLLRNVDLFNNCQDLAGVPFVPNPADAVASFGILRQSFPNPASARLAIQFQLKRAGPVTLRVFDVSGRHVTTLLDRALEAGSHQALWNARDNDGRKVASGVYVYELAMGGERLTRTMVVTQ